MSDGLVLLDANMEEPVLYEQAGFQLAYFSARSPDKDTANEDALGVFASPDGVVFAVADGAGGQRAGAHASAVAIRALHSQLDGLASDTRLAILDAIESANRELCQQGVGALTTIAVVEVQADSVRTYHAGDSAVLVCGQRGRLRLQTLSHSPVAYAVESGLLDEQDALQHDERHLVSNMLGMADMRIDIGAACTLARHDTLLVASDGLFDNLQVDEIVALIRCGPFPRAARELARQAAQRMQASDGKPDDLSFILLRRTVRA